MSAQWTWLVYMAGDNNLEGAGRDDLAEMKRVGSTAEVNLLVQFDTEQKKTIRYRVERNRLKVMRSMPGVDCGDPKVLTDFIKWGTRNFPAEHYLVDVWNHGGGWENLPSNYNYDALRSAQPQMSARLGRVQRAVFRTTVKKIHRRPRGARAIAIDCGSHDYLDNQELRRAITNALPDGRKIDVLGCDACLMNMFEIGYEMKGAANIMVGSEESEPGAGWPYAAILKLLTKKPTMSPGELAGNIVEAYGSYFHKSGETATQSALDLTRIETAALAINELAGALLRDLKRVAGAVSLARDKSQKFEMPEYIDLGDFAKQLIQRLPHDPKIKAAALQVLGSLQAKKGHGFVIQNVACGAKVKRATGVSIYFPHRENYAPDYRDLLFSRKGRWKKFLEGMFKI